MPLCEEDNLGKPRQTWQLKEIGRRVDYFRINAVLFGSNFAAGWLSGLRKGGCGLWEQFNVPARDAWLFQLGQRSHNFVNKKMFFTAYISSDYDSWRYPSRKFQVIMAVQAYDIKMHSIG